MPAITTYTKPLTTEQAKKLRGEISDRGFTFETKQYCLYAASKPGLNVLVYEKGPKVLVQGKHTEDFVLNTLEPLILGKAEMGYEEVVNPDMFTAHIGVDESGKGDFFGPLVIAGAYVDANVARALQAAGVMDSKRIGSDARIQSIARSIRATPGIAFEVIAIGPEKYNQMYASFGNLNRLLAWGHAKVIEQLLIQRPDCPRALSDQFANPAILQRALQERGKSIILEQRTKAESDPAVAAASILAREKFVSWLTEAETRLGCRLPKGASAEVKACARELVTRHGEATLRTVAKAHFKTYAEVMGIAPLE
ncbi:MAG: ribonuclease [Verrucomicrobiaceae bacterium]|nr:ribonuclease [Verrucomicrobiaceae bacterium]